MRTILVIDDDPHIREILAYALERAGFRVSVAEDGKQGLAAFERERPDLIVLDILMPEMNGTEVCKAVRASSDTPIIFLTSVDEEVDRILGLEMGGDDYLTKPFSPRELAARVKAVLRRVTPREPAEETVTRGRLSVRPRGYRAFWDGVEVLLTPTEFRIVQALATHPGKVYTREDLMDHAYPDGAVVSDRTIDSHIKRVRKKFEEAGGSPISTVHGLGYRLSEC